MAIYPRQPIFFVNLKSNTMKNTEQRYALSYNFQNMSKEGAEI